MSAKQGARKRKAATLDDDSDSDCIVVKTAKVWPMFANQSAKKRPAMNDLDPPQMHNKQARTLKCVLIPSPSKSELLGANETQHMPQSTTVKSLLNPASPDPHFSVKPRAQATSHPDVKTGTALAIDGDTPKSEDIIMENPKTDVRDIGACPQRMSKRPARKRQSYLDHFLMEGLSEEDELAAPMPKTSRHRSRQKKRSVLSDHSDYEDEESASSDPDIASEEVDEGSSVASAEAKSDVDDVKPVSARSKSSKTAPSRDIKKRTATSNGKKKAASLVAPGKKLNIMRKRGAGSNAPLGLDESVPPLSDPESMFADIAKKAVGLGFEDVAKHIGRRAIRVATMCSGTESPLYAMQMFQHALSQSTELDCQIEHLFSAEIEPVKQAFIERNHSPPILFRDVTELTSAMKDENPMATTAYGARVAVPTGVDVVIAGTSCIDFSNLNNRKKALDEDGESGQTWNGVLSYCTVARPPIVIIENVLHAPWETMIKYYEDAGYDTACVLVDTKDYYVPHTRQRGYLIAFDKAKCKEKGVSDPAARWQGLMKDFQRYASSPYVSFLLPNDRISRRLQIRTEEVTREVNWALCELRHIKERRNFGLGIDRPYTHWQESGTMVVPEGWDPNWLKPQVERVKDTIEMAILRNYLEFVVDKSDLEEKRKPNGDSVERRRMFDSIYKTRIWNLSQNVDRETDNTPWGIAPCITPSAQFVISDARRALLPEEQMRLQGFSLDRISFTTETPAEIQSLSGNAMTTTVVGAAIVSALISGHKLLPQDDGSTSSRPPNSAETAGFVAGPSVMGTLTPEDAVMDFHDYIAAARKALRRCVCEGRSGVAAKSIQQCLDCGHTSCVACGGEPPHNYHQSPLLFPSRDHPLAFEKEWTARLPLKLAFRSAESLFPVFAHSSNSKLQARFTKAARAAALETFAYVGIRRTHCWTAMYESECARLELVVDTSSAAWRVFVKPSAQSAVKDPLRRALEQPVFTMDLDAPVEKHRWRVRTLSSQSEEIKITRSDTMVASHWQRCQMPDFLNHVVPEFLEVESSNAGSTCNLGSITGRYRHAPKCGKANHSLWIKEEARSQKPTVYLFLDPSRIGRDADDTFVFATNKEDLEHDEVRPVLARVSPAWRPWSHGAGPKVRKTTVSFDGVWQQAPRGVGIMSAKMNIRLKKPPNIVVSDTCSQPSLLMECITTLNQTDNADETSRSTFIFEAMRRSLQGSEWRVLEGVDVSSPCRDCAPPRPSLKWELDKKSGTIRPYEDPFSAAQYERAVKAGVNPVVIQTDLHGADHTTKFGVHLKTLAHRAAARLPLPLIASEMQAEWRLETHINRAPTSVPDFHLRSTTDVSPCATNLGMSIELFPIQQRALAWMRRQEAGKGQGFTLEECEEASSSEAGWRAEVRVKRPVHVRGGLCADHPGFGKTITTLALMRAELIEKTTKAIVDEITSQQPQHEKEFIATPAYLVVCPGTLVKQWLGEIRDKVGFKAVVTINNMADLAKCTFDSFKKAQVVVLNRSVLAAEAYAERLATFVGVPGPATKSGSSYEVWLDHVLRRMPAHLQTLRNSGIKALENQVKHEYKQSILDDTYQAWVPSRRTRGVEKSNSGMKKSSITTQPAAAALNTSTLKAPLFEMFCFARLVIDEFQEYDARELTALKNIKAHTRWALSGTPPINDTYEVAQLGALLGVQLPTGAGARGRMKLKNIRKMEKDRTDFERFDAMRQIPSEEAYARLHEHHQGFLDAFGRRNILEEGSIPYEEHLVPIELDLDHRVRYAEISQHLNSLGMRIPKAGKNGASTKTDKRSRIFRAVEGSESPEEALSRDAAYSDRQQNAGLDALISKRQRQRATTLSILRKALIEARNLEGDPANDWASWRRSKLEEGTLGDDETIQLVQDLSSGKAQISTNDEVDSSGEESGASQGNGIAKLMGLCDQLLLSVRSLRYLNGVRHIQEKIKMVRCDSPKCEGLIVNDVASTKHMAVSAHCGHRLCKTCHDELRTKYHTCCPAIGCRGTVEEYHLLWNHKMGKQVKSGASPFGAKWKSAIEILEQIRAKNDQAILFVQYANQLDEAQTVLDHAGICASIVQSGPQASDQISDFQNKSKNITVIVLNASDETAAGLNLQNANHVIFLSPLLRDTQYGYDSTMKQAIGRVRRYGQKKLVHVYHLVALDTIDVDILEHRARRTTAMKEQSADPIDRPAALKALDVGAEPKPERTQLIRENGKFSLRPQSWLVMCNSSNEGEEEEGVHVKGKSRVLGYEDFSSQVKFSKAYTEDND